jgi:hypothetical protein
MRSSLEIDVCETRICLLCDKTGLCSTILRIKTSLAGYHKVITNANALQKPCFEKQKAKK